MSDGKAPGVGRRSRQPKDQSRSAEQEALNKVLAREPAARTEEVTRGRELSATVDYPSEEVIRRISQLLADCWAERGDDGGSLP